MARAFLRLDPATLRVTTGKYVRHQNTRERIRRLRQLADKPPPPPPPVRHV